MLQDIAPHIFHGEYRQIPPRPQDSVIAGRGRALLLREPLPGSGPEQSPFPTVSDLEQLGIRLYRFKTGTPCRIDGRTIGFSQAQMLKAQNEEDFSSASETAECDEKLVWISGYIPEVDLETFKAGAKANNWAYAVEDVSPEDETIPTKLRYNKVTKLISPLYDMLGILPGYREADISLWFLIFFALFTAGGIAAFRKADLK